jgi:cytochrome oxidase assembly protein ShyY1
MGPRGALAGVSMPRQGMSKGRGGQSGMAPGPQGFHVLTPLQVNDNNGNSTDSRMVWINRGWVPKTMVPNTTNNRDSTRRVETSPDQAVNSWSRPKGPVQLTTIRSSPESMFVSFE